MTELTPEPLAVDVQTGPEPSDMVRIAIVDGSHDRERAIAAVLEAHGITVIGADVPPAREYHLSDEFIAELSMMSVPVFPEFQAIPIVRIASKRKPTQAEWRRQMKGYSQ